MSAVGFLTKKSADLLKDFKKNQFSFFKNVDPLSIEISSMNISDALSLWIVESTNIQNIKQTIEHICGEEEFLLLTCLEKVNDIATYTHKRITIIESNLIAFIPLKPIDNLSLQTASCLTKDFQKKYKILLGKKKLSFLDCFSL